jgi:hypothetical protein
MLLRELFEAKEWVAAVKTKKTPPEGLFAEGSSKDIATWLVAAHKDLKGAMGSLNFYINRAGDKLEPAREKVLNSVKKKLETHYKKD